ncbi:MAG: MlaD family protein [Ottowia sp.]|nr:MlaD family protein [Ottowia sp.]
MAEEDETQDDEAPAVTVLSGRARRGVEFRAILLLLFMAAVLLGSALYLMGARGAFEVTQPLYLLTDDSEGVVVGMDMTFSGFPVGRVSKIDLVGSGEVQIRVDVPVKDAHWLRTSSVYTLERGLVGAARLRAFTGLPDDPPLPDGARRPLLRGDVSEEIPRMVTDARDVLQNIEQLTSRRSDLRQTLQRINVLSGQLASADPESGGLLGALTGNPEDARQISATLGKLNELVTHLDAVVLAVHQQVLGPGGVASEAQAATRELQALLRDVRAAVARLDRILDDGEAVSGNLRTATDGLDDLRGDVQDSLDKVDGMVTELRGKWPFAPSKKEITLP